MAIWQHGHIELNSGSCFVTTTRSTIHCLLSLLRRPCCSYKQFFPLFQTCFAVDEIRRSRPAKGWWFLNWFTHTWERHVYDYNRPSLRTEATGREFTLSEKNHDNQHCRGSAVVASDTGCDLRVDWRYYEEERNSEAARGRVRDLSEQKRSLEEKILVLRREIARLQGATSREDLTALVFENVRDLMEQINAFETFLSRDICYKNDARTPITLKEGVCWSQLTRVLQTLRQHHLLKSELEPANAASLHDFLQAEEEHCRTFFSKMYDMIVLSDFADIFSERSFCVILGAISCAFCLGFRFYLCNSTTLPTTFLPQQVYA